MKKYNSLNIKIKDKNFRYNFLIQENKHLIKKIFIDCDLFFSNKTRMFYWDWFKNSKIIIKNRCVLSSNAKCLKDFKLSRHKLRIFIIWGFNGIYKI